MTTIIENNISNIPIIFDKIMRFLGFKYLNKNDAPKTFKISVLKIPNNIPKMNQ